MLSTNLHPFLLRPQCVNTNVTLRAPTFATSYLLFLPRIFVLRDTSLFISLIGSNAAFFFASKSNLQWKKKQVTFVATVCISNSLTPGKFEWNFRHVIFKHILVIDGWGISCEIALILMPLDFTDDQSTLVQVMAWCLQVTSLYLSQCWTRSQLPYGVTRPQWLNEVRHGWWP